MPVFCITYATTGHDQLQSLEWVTESHWDEERTRRCFEERHPNAAIASIEAIEGSLPYASPASREAAATTQNTTEPRNA